MKNISLLSSRCPLAAPGWLLSLALLTGGWAGAQNFVRNPDFRQPLGPDNWTIVYVSPSSASDFYMAGRSTLAHRDKVYGTWDGNYFGLHFRLHTCGLVEAYATQTVSNLTPHASYVVTAWMTQFQSSYVSKIQVWLEALGGPNGTQSFVTPYVTGYCYNNNGWLGYSVNCPASTSGQIVVRLHYKTVGTTQDSKTTPKWLSMDAFYDHVSVMPLVQTTLPAPRILSLTVTNQTAAFNWATTMNNTDDIQVSSDLVSWSPFQTGFYATGTNLTYTTNLVVNPGVPQFFRILSHNYLP